MKKAAAGALWEIEGKEKHAEDKQQSVKESGEYAQLGMTIRLQ